MSSSFFFVSALGCVDWVLRLVSKVFLIQFYNLRLDSVPNLMNRHSPIRRGRSFKYFLCAYHLSVAAKETESLQRHSPMREPFVQDGTSYRHLVHMSSSLVESCRRPFVSARLPEGWDGFSSPLKSQCFDVWWHWLAVGLECKAVVYWARDWIMIVLLPGKLPCCTRTLMVRYNCPSIVDAPRWSGEDTQNVGGVTLFDMSVGCSKSGGWFSAVVNEFTLREL